MILFIVIRIEFNQLINNFWVQHFNLNDVNLTWLFQKNCLLLLATTANTATLTFTIDVNDKNDETPSCSPRTYDDTFAEHVTTPATVASLSCSDTEAAPNGGTLDYSIVTVNGAAPGAQFTVDASGILQVFHK